MLFRFSFISHDNAFSVDLGGRFGQSRNNRRRTDHHEAELSNPFNEGNVSSVFGRAAQLCGEPVLYTGVLSVVGRPERV